MKVALCFIISYEHILNKEHIWREWIEPNKDIINVYFYYKDLRKIKSKWIMEHTLPPSHIHETSYFYVIPAYMSVLNFAFQHDTLNKWFCLLTDSCCPIISPKRFRYLFFKHNKSSIFSWKEAWWNPSYHKRANLSKLPKELWLANDPWFTLTREHVETVIHFISAQEKITNIVCSGGLANESLFAIILKLTGKLNKNIISSPSHITDWFRMSSTTSPHLFDAAGEADIAFIEKELRKNNCALFIRKMSPSFPDDTLRHYIYEYRKNEDDKLVLKEPFELVYHKFIYSFTTITFVVLLIIGLYIFVDSILEIFLF